MSGAFSRICTRPYTIILTVRVWVLAGMILNKLDRHGHTTSIPTPRKGFPLVAALEQTAVHNSAHCRRGGAEKRWNRSVKVEKGAIPHTHRRGRAHVHTRMSVHLFSMDVDVASFKVYALLCHDLSTLDSRGSTRGG